MYSLAKGWKRRLEREERARREQQLISLADKLKADLDQLCELQRNSQGKPEAPDNIDDYRRVHQTARTCFENGYRVSYGCLPYLVALHSARATADVDTPEGRQEYAGWNAEISSVYDFKKYYRLGGWAERPPVPVDEGFWENYLTLIESANG